MDPLPSEWPDELLQMQRIEAACVSFEAGWQQGNRPSISEVLQEGAPGDRPTLLEELLLIEWHYREKLRQPLDIVVYREQFAALAGAVETAWRRWLNNSTVSESKESARDTTSPHGSPTVRPGQQPPGELPVVPGYQELRWLGEGGMGLVYRALQPPPLDREVALKVIKAEMLSASQLQRFHTEAAALARLQHPHIVQVYDWEEPARGSPILVLEYVPGGNLADRLIGPLAPLDAARLVAILARAVHHAHEQGIVHRDLKPANVLLGPPLAGNQGTVLGSFPKVSDFGLAHLVGGAEMKSGVVQGTPLYMAPEQADGRAEEVGPASDVWALGVILYRCLTGEEPFKGGSTNETLELVRAAVVPPLRVRGGEVPAELEAICLRCLQKKPRKRPTAEVLAEMLERFLADRPVGTESGRLRWVLGLVAVFCVALAVGWWMPFKKGVPEEQNIGSKQPDAEPVASPWEVSMAVKVLKNEVWRSIELPGTLPVRPDDLVRVEVKLNRPAYSYLLLLSSQGEVVPLYPWNEEELKVKDANAAPPLRREQVWGNPRKGTVGWDMDDTPGLETLLLLVRDEPLPVGVKLRQLLGEVPAGRKAPLRDPGEAAVIDLQRSKPEYTNLLAINRGVRDKARQTDEPLLKVMDRLRETFVVQRAARFAHTAK